MKKSQFRDKPLLSKMFLKFFLKKGKMQNAHTNLKRLFNLLFEKTNLGEYSILNKIYKILYINFEVRKIKKYRSSHLVPIPLTKKRRFFLVMKWLFDSIEEDKKNVSIVVKLSSEILKYLENSDSQGKKKKYMMKKLALQNRANAHYRWY
jgi:small subunit ribosomal protein S7